MALPSPLFMKNVVKPVVEIKPHVEQRRPAPLQSVAYCKFCREGFSNENELYQHRRNHERCPYDDCKFNANAETVAAHVQKVHIQKGNALVKIQDLTTPEQIEKWREERRKRYPTTNNVLLRQQAQVERFQRGEKLQDRQQRFGDFQQRNHIRDMDKKPSHRNDNQQQNNRRKRHHKERNPRNEKYETKKETEIEKVPLKVPRIEPKPVEFKKPLTSIKVLQVLNDESSDDEKVLTPRFKGTSQMKGYHKVETIVKEQAALSILGMYGSDSESGSEGEILENAVKIEDSTIIENNVVDEKETVEEPMEEVIESGEILDDAEDTKQSSDNEAPEESTIEHSSQIPEKLSMNSKPPKHPKWNEKIRKDFKLKQPRTVLDYSKLRKPSVNPFLEKLLQEDIRHERNVLLQCVNYVVKNNFFGVGQSAKPLEVKPESIESANVESVENL